MSLARSNCGFCQYFHAHHDAVRCPCSACWSRRRSGDSANAAGRIALSKSVNVAPALSRVATSFRGDSAVAVASAAGVEAAPAVSEGPCPHSAEPYHHCRSCVLPPYFARQQAHWDGHAVVCAPSAHLDAGCGCAATRRCHRGTSCAKVPMLPLPQYAAHEVPIMGPLASLYIKS
ncbi:hypothetical protein Q4I30_007089 [Leishmania utingensis]|uniref:Uncharacterized protein n=1 Tax=Leishmania utingensis TaxID=653362 RepID=A0AAW3A0D8_9TRYP